MASKSSLILIKQKIMNNYLKWIEHNEKKSSLLNYMALMKKRILKSWIILIKNYQILLEINFLV